MLIGMNTPSCINSKPRGEGDFSRTNPGIDVQRILIGANYNIGDFGDLGVFAVFSPVFFEGPDAVIKEVY